ncbi:MAG: YARHG domain-containing protein [Treponema sp.]|jgi:hypothetical protein|nr:YARHG domain-containing protein [Treponema sp.]
MKKTIFLILFFFLFFGLSADENIIYIGKNQLAGDNWGSLTHALKYYNGLSDVIDFDYGLRVLWGNANLLDFPIENNIFLLANVEKKYFRLIRNMVYAKHGLKFKSEDLNKYFSQFEWYKPLYNNVDKFLTEVEESNLSIIKEFENMNENQPSVNWEKNCIGVWSNDYRKRAHEIGNKIIIYPDNAMEYKYWERGYLEVIDSLKGKYELKGNVLQFKVDQIKYFMHGTNVELDVFYKYENREINTITLEKPMIFNFPVTNITQNKITYDGNQIFEGLQSKIAGARFYKISE